MPDRRIATVVMLDIVGSTQVAAQLGDARYRELSSRFARVVRAGLRRAGGHEEDHAGDGFFLTFPQPDRAIRFASALADDVRELGIEIRTGIHTGQTESQDGKTQGIAVVIGARVMSLAGAGEILVTSTTKELVTGSDFGFEDLSAHELKGVPGTWQVFAVTSVEGAERARPLPAGEAARRLGDIRPGAGRKRPRRAAFVGGVAAVLATIVIATIVATTGPGVRGPGPSEEGNRLSAVVELDPEHDPVVVGTIEIPEIQSGPAGTHPAITAHPIAVGQGGIWIVRPYQWLVHVDPTLADVRAKIGLGSGVSFSLNLAVGYDKIWAATQDGLFEVNPATDERRAAIRFAPEEIHAAAADVAIGRGSVWLGTGDGRLFRLDPRTGETEERAGLGEIDTIAFGDGSLWAADAVGETVTRYDPETLHRTAEISVQGGIDYVAVGDVGAWALSRTAGAVREIDLESNEVRATVQVGATPTCLAAGLNAIWVCDRDGSIRRVDEATRQVTILTTIDGEPRGIAVDEDTETLWVNVT
jgi:class 3 adenylate cyclase/outer membrane protein assembly factor BamB